MEAWERRFLMEFVTLKERAERLGDMVQKYHEGTLNFEPKCPISLLERQLEVMKEYISILVERADIEGISLED